MVNLALSTPEQKIPTSTLDFYRDVLTILSKASVPFLVGGTYALNHHAGIQRTTKDLDLFIHQRDLEHITSLLEDTHYQCDLRYPHWLAKIYDQDDFIDLIFNSGNGIAEVDELWFEHAVAATLFDVKVQLCPVEETIWSKAFIMERERFDGADIAHLILASGNEMDWPRLLMRFDQHWRPLLSHLILFGFIYPAEQHLVPTWVMDKLLRKLHHEVYSTDEAQKLCGGTLLSREQYIEDIQQHDFKDARVSPYGNLTQREAADWTEASQKDDSQANAADQNGRGQKGGGQKGDSR